MVMTMGNNEFAARRDTSWDAIVKKRKEEKKRARDDPEFDENLADPDLPDLEEESAETEDRELRKNEDEEFDENMDGMDDEIDDD
jgi:hypothetical protein